MSKRAGHVRSSQRDIPASPIEAYQRPQVALPIGAIVPKLDAGFRAHMAAHNRHDGVVKRSGHPTRITKQMVSRNGGEPLRDTCPIRPA